jgi:hypothetical protein
MELKNTLLAFINDIERLKILHQESESDNKALEANVRSAQAETQTAKIELLKKIEAAIYYIERE